MNRPFYHITAILLSFCFILSSCMSSDEEEVEYSSQCYISAFTLGQMARTMHTTDSLGNDSTYTLSFNGSQYPLLIDQRNHLITNVDSLPTGTRLLALATITGTGSVEYRAADSSDEWTGYSTSDSIDFSRPLIFRVQSADGASYREYQLQLHVRQSEPLEYTWNRMADLTASASANATKLLMVSTQPYILSYNATTSQVSLFTSSDPAALWNEQVCSGLSSTADPCSACYFQGQFWMSDRAGKLFRSSDAIAWTEVALSSAAPLLQLIVASPTALYASFGDGTATPIFVAQSTDGASWTALSLDEEEGGFTGTPEAALAYEQSNGNARVLMVDDPTGGTGSLSAWSFLEGANEPWTLFASDGDNDYLLPAQKHLNIIAYNGNLVALGGDLFTEAGTALQQAFVSYDNGITWRVEEYLVPPTDVQGAAGPVAAASAEDYIWLVAGNQVWRARLNSYGE